MAAPTAPFSTTAQIAYLLLNMFPGQSAPDFTASTRPTLAMVQSVRSLISAELQATLASVGYKIPLEELSGETWPEHQTNMLALLEASGTAGLLASSLSPAPAMVQGRGRGGVNVFTAAYKQALDQIRATGMGLRAGYYTGSRAQQWLTEPRGPMTDYTIEAEDPSKFGLMAELLKLYQNMFSDVAEMDIDWDYFYLKSTRASDG